MNSNKAAKLRMFIAVTNVCDSYATAYATLPAFDTGYTQFKGLVTQINEGNKLLQKGTTGITDDKLARRTAMAKATILVAAPLAAYAHSTNNLALADEASITKDDILHCKETDADDLCLNIYDLGKANLANLANFGVTQAALDALEASIESFTEKIGSPRKRIIDTKIIRANIDTYFTKADELLTKQLDNLIVVLQSAHPDFYAAYTAARIIVDEGGSSSGAAEEKPVG